MYSVQVFTVVLAEAMGVRRFPRRAKSLNHCTICVSPKTTNKLITCVRSCDLLEVLMMHVHGRPLGSSVGTQTCLGRSVLQPQSSAHARLPAHIPTLSQINWYNQAKREFLILQYFTKYYFFFKLCYSSIH